MGHRFFPTMLGKREAHFIFPALSEEDRSRITEEELADEITQMLIRSGDMEDYQCCTEQGESNGFYNTTGSGYEYDDDGFKTMHCRLDFAMPTRKGSEYIISLLKAKYPLLDRDLVFKLKDEENLKSRLDTARSCHDGFQTLPSKLIDIIHTIAKDEASEYHYYFRCGYDVEKEIIGVFDGYRFVYDLPDVIVISPEEMETIVKHSLLRDDKYRLRDFLLSYKRQRTFFLIDRIEDITRFVEARSYLEMIIDWASRYKIRIIFLSDKDPSSIDVDSEELGKVLDSAFYYDCREDCIKSKKEYLEIKAEVDKFFEERAVKRKKRLQQMREEVAKAKRASNG